MTSCSGMVSFWRGLAVAAMLAVLAAPPARGQDAAPAAGSGVATGRVAVATNAVDVEGVGAELRDPFWPVGVTPRPDVVEVARSGVAKPAEDPQKVSEEEWKAALAELAGRVKGTLRTPGRDGREILVALVNGRQVCAGDVVPVYWDGRTLQFVVKSISLRHGPVFERVLPNPGSGDKNR